MIEKPASSRKDTQIYGEKERYELPSSLPEIVSDSDTLKNIFDCANTEWLKVFNPTELILKLREYLRLSPEERSGKTELLRYLRFVRRRGQTLKSATYFCNKEKTVSSSLDRFLKYLGKAIDAFSMSLGDVYANKVLKILGKNELEPHEQQPTHVEDFNQRLDILMQKIRQHLMSTTITLDQFHSLRKDLRSIKHLFALMKVQTGCDARIQVVSEYLTWLNAEMGKIRDLYLFKELMKEIDPAQTVLEIDLQFKVRIQRFLELLQMRSVS